jgi:putative transposase
MELGLAAGAIELTKVQRELLNEILNGRTSKRAHADRSQIILLCAEGKTNYRIGKELGISEEVASKWRKRWQLNAEQLAQAETEEEKGKYKKRVLKVLDDAPRSGCPGKFSAEQVCHILSVACEAPEESEHPLSHWSLSSLVTEVVNRGIVPSISKSQMHVFLKLCGYQAAQSEDVDSHTDRR